MRLRERLTDVRPAQTETRGMEGTRHRSAYWLRSGWGGGMDCAPPMKLHNNRSHFKPPIRASL